MVSFLLVLRPTDVVCGVQQTAIGLCFSVVYAALFTKTNRIARIFRGGKKSAGRPGLISPKSQLAICGGLVAIHLCFKMSGFSLVKPKTEYNLDRALCNGRYNNDH
jgi:metabotropic X receptor